MSADEVFKSFLRDARDALARLDDGSRKTIDVIDRIAALKYAEGTLVGFLQAAAVTDPELAKRIAPQVESFIAEAIAARIMLE